MKAWLEVIILTIIIIFIYLILRTPFVSGDYQTDVSIGSGGESNQSEYSTNLIINPISGCSNNSQYTLCLGFFSYIYSSNISPTINILTPENGVAYLSSGTTYNLSILFTYNTPYLNRLYYYLKIDERFIVNNRTQLTNTSIKLEEYGNYNLTFYVKDMKGRESYDSIIFSFFYKSPEGQTREGEYPTIRVSYLNYSILNTPDTWLINEDTKSVLKVYNIYNNPYDPDIIKTYTPFKFEGMNKVRVGEYDILYYTPTNISEGDYNISVEIEDVDKRLLIIQPFEVRKKTIIRELEKVIKEISDDVLIKPYEELLDYIKKNIESDARKPSFLESIISKLSEMSDTGKILGAIIAIGIFSFLMGGFIYMVFFVVNRKNENKNI